jgi:MFS family permease
MHEDGDRLEVVDYSPMRRLARPFVGSSTPRSRGCAIASNGVSMFARRIRPWTRRAHAVERGAVAVEQQLDHGVEVLTEKVGGPARLRAVLLLAAVLALSAADTGAIAAVAPQLEKTLRIGNIQIGLLVTMSSLTAAAAMLPAGWITDRSSRTRMLTVAVSLWGTAQLVSAVAPTYAFLLVIRLALGALTAVTGPTIASLTGDLFPAGERSKIYGYILTGELLGAGFGLLVAGLLSAWFSWRVAFGVLALPSALLAYEFHRRLPEPARGGESRLEPGAQDIVSAEDVETGHASSVLAHLNGPADDHAAPDQDSVVLKEVRRRRVDHHEGVVLDRDPLELGWWESFRYVVSVPSNVVFIVSSALGYFFFTGVEVFALIYVQGHFGVRQEFATFIALAVGAAGIAGTITGGRVTDSLLRRGSLDARLIVPASGFALAIIAFVPAVISSAIAISLPLFLVAGFLIAVPNPGLDAARLDIMPSRMWGRAEAVRSFLRSILQACAPLVFGLVSAVFGATNEGLGASGSGTHRKAVAGQASGLEPTFLVMLGTLAAAAAILWWGRRPYPVDVAAADATERRFPASAEETNGRADEVTGSRRAAP